MKELRLKKNGKAPLVAGAFGGEDYKLIQAWAQEGGNVGALTGSASGIAVIDIDTHKGVNGMGNLIEFLDTYDIELPKTKVVKTPSGGYHFYFKLDEKYNETQFIQNHPQLKGVDFQTHGRYVVAPPSQIDGKYYEVVRDVEIAELPEKWLEMFTDKTITKKNKKRERKWTANLLGDIIAGCGEGSRNIFLTSIIGKLFATGLNHDEVRVWSLYVNQIGCVPPLSEDEVLQTYKSVRKRELRRMEED
ncbi:DNA polymerase/primase [Enterococcus phage IME-EFm5]|uniref:DNA replication protein n=1 Tax=Enterococcus phage IME-EFm5 TaxID=1718158 RepID=A0A0M4S5F8_9CAUD|nr:DNA polymerase/primase [Enterococcus phage IME-EFm5]ALF01982.1 DNA replication protein [Enterococcus phage IME-EFm5]